MTSSEMTFLVEEAPEGGYVARGLGTDIFAEADDRDSLRSMVQDAVAAHFDAGERPSVFDLHWVRDELIAAG